MGGISTLKDGKQVQLISGVPMVIAVTEAVRCFGSAPTAAIGRLARPPIRKVATWNSIRVTWARSTASNALPVSPCAPSQNKVLFI